MKWKEEFDKKFIDEDNNLQEAIKPSEIKDFIQSLLDEQKVHMAEEFAKLAYKIEEHVREKIVGIISETNADSFTFDDKSLILKHELINKINNLK